MLMVLIAQLTWLDSWSANLFDRSYRRVRRLPTMRRRVVQARHFLHVVLASLHPVMNLQSMPRQITRKNKEST